MAQSSPYGVQYITHPQYYIAPHAQHPHFSAQLLGAQVARQEQQRKRPKYTRSKTGCLTCRQKKIKCDESKPSCQRCTLGQRECSWPEGVIVKKKVTQRMDSAAEERPSTSSSCVSETSSSPEVPSVSQEYWTGAMPATSSPDQHYAQKMQYTTAASERAFNGEQLLHQPLSVSNATSMRRMSVPIPQISGTHPGASSTLGAVPEYSSAYPTPLPSPYGYDQADMSSRHSSRPNTASSLPPSRYSSDSEQYNNQSMRMLSSAGHYIDPYSTSRSYMVSQVPSEPTWAYQAPALREVGEHQMYDARAKMR